MEKYYFSIKMKGFIFRDDITKSKKYFTLDNGRLPYMVEVDVDSITIYMRTSDGDKLIREEYQKKVKKITNFEGYWDGKDTTTLQKKQNGNSILIKIKNGTYLFVGYTIFSFKTKDEILEFYSPIGNNDVPYPVAYGEKWVYFFLEKKKVERELFHLPLNKKNSQDLYIIYYGFLLPDGSKRPKLKSPSSRKERIQYQNPTRLNSTPMIGVKIYKK